AGAAGGASGPDGDPRHAGPAVRAAEAHRRAEEPDAGRGRRRRSGRPGDRRGAADAGAAQPARQRGEVHRRRRGAADRPVRPGPRGLRRHRHRAGHTARLQRTGLRGVLPGARHQRAGNGPRPPLRPQAHRRPRRRTDPGQHSRRGNDGHGPAAHAPAPRRAGPPARPRHRRRRRVPPRPPRPGRGRRRAGQRGPRRRRRGRRRRVRCARPRPARTRNTRLGRAVRPAARHHGRGGHGGAAGPPAPGPRRRHGEQGSPRSADAGGNGMGHQGTKGAAMTDAERVTALVVDDEDTKRYVIGSWLQRAGHTVVYASNAAEMWQRLAEHDVNLIVLDVKLPDMSGIEAGARIKTDPETASMPVIHISAWAVDVADRTRGLQRGADAYLTDPIDPDEFIATVEAVMRYYRARVRAERVAGQLTAFTRTSLAINGAENFEELTMVAARGAYEIFAEPASVLVLPPDGRTRRAVSLHGEVVEQRASPDHVFDELSELMELGDGADTGVAFVSAHQWKSVLPDAVAHGDVAVVMSRSKGGRPPICIGIEAQGQPDEVDLNILRQLGQALALAMEAMRSFTEQHTISLTLQRSLLPARHPLVPG